MGAQVRVSRLSSLGCGRAAPERRRLWSPGWGGDRAGDKGRAFTGDGVLGVCGVACRAELGTLTAPGVTPTTSRGAWLRHAW